MQSFGKRCLAAATASVTLGLATFGVGLVTAGTASANAPGGFACDAANGKIYGSGAVLEGAAENAWWAAYDSEFCGDRPNGDQAGNDEGIYNYPGTLVSPGFTGAGNGLIAANNRIGDYWGTSNPYTTAQLNLLDGTPGPSAAATANKLAWSGTPSISTLSPPFPPDSATNTSFPASTDQAANVLTIPVAGSAIAIVANIPAAGCTSGVAPSSLNFTSSEIAGILGGSILTWGSTQLTGNNPSLAGCTTAITRVVRFDSAGQTSIVKQYLVDVEPSRASEACAPTTSWQTLYSSNTTWTGGTTATGTCSAYAKPTTSGGAALLTLLGTTPGGIGYDDLPDVEANGSSFIQASLENQAGTGYVSPVSGLGANCDLSAVSEPGNGSSTALVGLDSGDTWATDNATANPGTGEHYDANDIGTAYPICGIAWDLVYSGLSAGPSSPTAIAALTVDQRRTLYSYITFVLSSLGQSILPNNYFAALPTLWQQPVLAGFQKNF
jgi:hypothetical protein